jgi:formate/nitrite transporter FocA (FNT family)
MAYIALYQKVTADVVRVLLVTTLGNIIGCNSVPLLLRFLKK